MFIKRELFWYMGLVDMSNELEGVGPDAPLVSGLLKRFEWFGVKKVRLVAKV